MKVETETVSNTENTLSESEVLDENININSDVGAAESIISDKDDSLMLKDEAVVNDFEKNKDSNGLENFGIEEETPNLFDTNNLEDTSNEVEDLSEKSISSEEDEFEIPAFLRRQKN